MERLAFWAHSGPRVEAIQRRSCLSTRKNPATNVGAFVATISVSTTRKRPPAADAGLPMIVGVTWMPVTVTSA